jgi:hypothetical protein
MTFIGQFAASEVSYSSSNSPPSCRAMLSIWLGGRTVSCAI